MDQAAAFGDRITIRNYNEELSVDIARVEELERRCQVSNRVFLFMDAMGDPICRIRNSPMYKMLVAETNKMELVGMIQGTIKLAAVVHKQPNKVGYILNLRVSPLHRRKGIGSSLVHSLQQWFIANQVDYLYMATEKDNTPSVNLFVNKFGFVKFRTPSILVNPVSRTTHSSINDFSSIEITKITIEQAAFLYRKFMGSSEFFPHDIDIILKNKFSLGTWVAYPRGESWPSPSSWAMVSVWNSGDVFKLRLGQAPLSCMVFSKTSRFIEKWLPCFKFVPCMPDFFKPFGFYFMYGVHREGLKSGKLVRTLCNFVNNMARNDSEDCKVVVTEIGGNDNELKHDIPHWKFLSCPEDLWCIKDLKNNQINTLHELIKTPPTTRALFVDPREV